VTVGDPAAARTEPAAFDAYAEGYEDALQRGVGLSGEDSSYFARERVAWVGRRLERMGMRARKVLDFGCGTGSTSQYLLQLPGTTGVLGMDVSSRLIESARRDYGSDRVEFATLAEKPDVRADLAYCNGVFHHIPLAQRAGAVASVFGALRPGGLFAFWENNPWNPGTRLVMHRIPFDRDAIMLSAREARRLLTAGGFEVLRTDFRFVFPRLLAPLRRFEPALAKAPLGAQYMVLVRRPPKDEQPPQR
jgi:SAM-dependent methyltransferase